MNLRNYINKMVYIIIFMAYVIKFKKNKFKLF